MSFLKVIILVIKCHDNDYIHTFSTMSSVKNSPKIYYSKTLRNNTSIIPVTTLRFYWWDLKSIKTPCLENHIKNKCIRDLHSKWDNKHLPAYSQSLSKISFLESSEIFSKISIIPGYYRTPSKEFYKIQTSSLDCIFKMSNWNTWAKHVNTFVFFTEKALILSLDINISLKQHKDTMVFIKEILFDTSLDNIDLQANWAYKSQSSKPTLSPKQSKRDKTHWKLIHFTKTWVYEYFPDWFRNGSMNSPIT